MKPHLPLSLLSALLACTLLGTPAALAVEIPDDYTAEYLCEPSELYDYRTVSTNKAFLLDGSVTFSSSTATWWQSEVLKSSGSILFTIEEDGDPYSLSFKDASYQAFHVSTLRIEDIGKVTFSGIQTTTGSSSYSYGAIEGSSISLLRNREVSISNNNSQSSNSSSYDPRGGAIYTSSSLKINENTRGVAISGNYASATRSRSSSSSYSTSTSSSSYGGAICGDSSSIISLNDNAGGLSLSGNHVYAYASDRNTYYPGSYADRDAYSYAYAYAYGGAIYGGSLSSIHLDGNADDLVISGNYASSSASASGTMRPNYLGTPSVPYAYAYGGAIYGGSSSIISLNDNDGMLSVMDNYTSTSTYRSYSCGGAIYGGSASSLTINGNTGGVRFTGNYAASTNSSSSVVTCGGAIYSEGSIAIQNNGDVIFSGNYEQSGSSYRLRSIYVNSSVTDGKFHLSAAVGKSITFEDSVYVTVAGSGQTIDVVFNGSYTDANGTIIAQEGDIIFDGGNAVDVLQGLKTNVSDEEILNSQTSYIGGVINLQAGRLVVRNGAHLDGLGLSTKARSGAVLVLQDGHMSHGSGSINLCRGTSLELNGQNSITAEAVSFSSGSTLQFSVGEAQRQDAVLNLDAMLELFSINLALEGDGMLASGRYKLLELTDASLYSSVDYWTADDITVTATGDAAGLGFDDLVWENGMLYVQQVKSEWSNASGDARWNASSANWQRHEHVMAYQDGMDVLFAGAGAGEVQLEGEIAPLSVTVDNAAGQDYIFAGSGKLSGETTLTKTGTGELTIATANDYTGQTELLEGTLNVHHSTALGATATGEASLTTAAGSTLKVANSSHLVLAGDYDLAGNVDVAAGSTLELQKDGRAAGALSGGGTLQVTKSHVVVESIADFSGTLHVAGGTLTFGAEGNIALNAGARLELQSWDNAVAGVTAGNITVKQGAALAAKADASELGDMPEISELALPVELNCSSLTLDAGAILDADGAYFDLNNGVLTLDVSTSSTEKIELVLAENAVYTGDEQIVLFTNVGQAVFAYDGISTGSESLYTLNAADYFTGNGISSTTQLVYDQETGTVYVQGVASIPEPTTATLSLLALVALTMRRRRK